MEPYITLKEEVEEDKLKILHHAESFDPLYPHMLIKKKKWQLPAAEAFAELVLHSIREKKECVSRLTPFLFKQQL